MNEIIETLTEELFQSSHRAPYDDSETGMGEARKYARRIVHEVSREALYTAARNLRAEMYGPYENESGYGADGLGNTCEKIDSWYAKYIEEQADRIGK